MRVPRQIRSPSSALGESAMFGSHNDLPSQLHLLLLSVLTFPVAEWRMDCAKSWPRKYLTMPACAWECLILRRGVVTNPGITPITILAINSDHGLSFAGEETRTMVSVSFSLNIYSTFEFWRFKFSVVWVLVWVSSFYGDGGGSRTVNIGVGVEGVAGRDAIVAQ